ncbi:MAG: hypothetical protein DRP96_00045 [Candidatus Neomarinimicrobiota bacterium]|nr:MAG: hypothetical protein DRP96_00045 [Candidatus Neomarinimicrobiota bacterium]
MKKGRYSALILILVSSLVLRADLPEGLRYKRLKSAIPTSYRFDFKRALSFLKKDQNYQAKIILERLVKTHPDFYVYWAYGYTERMMNNTASARALYFKAFEMNDSLLTFLRDYADFVEATSAEWLVVRRLTRALYTAQPDDYPLMFMLDKAVETGQQSAALDFLRELAETHPGDTRIGVFQAVVLSYLGRGTEAVQSALEVVEDTESLFQLQMLERILANNGYFVEAAGACEKMTGIAKKSAVTYSAWGHLEFMQGHYENAVTYYRKSLNADYRPSTLIKLARITLLYLNDPKQAVYYGKSALQIDRRESDACFILAESYRRLARMDKALDYSSRLLKLMPDHPHPYYYHGKLLFELKRYTEAVTYLEQAVALSPEVQRYRLILAKAYAGAGQKDRAKAIYTNFINEPIGNLWSEEELLKEEPPEPR